MSNPEPEFDQTVGSRDLGKQMVGAAFCHCFLSWMTPIPNPFVSNPGFAVINTSNFGWTETETDVGVEHWKAMVHTKFYNPATGQVFFAIPQVVQLPRNPYSKTRSRTVGWVGFAARWWPFAFPPWPAWPAPTRGPVNTGSQALAAAGLTECTTVGIPCP